MKLAGAEYANAKVRGRQPDPDQYVIVNISRGCERSFEALYTTYFDSLTAAVMNRHGLSRFDAEDIAAEALLLVPKLAHKFTERKTGLVSGWLLGIARMLVMKKRDQHYHNEALKRRLAGVNTWTVEDKYCRGCVEVLPASAFRLQSTSADGLTSLCKQCLKEKGR